MSSVFHLKVRKISEYKLTFKNSSRPIKHDKLQHHHFMEYSTMSFGLWPVTLLSLEMFLHINHLI